ncbi:MAG: potassium transporter TrkG [Pseudomonadota bacterium]
MRGALFFLAAALGGFSILLILPVLIGLLLDDHQLAMRFGLYMTLGVFVSAAGLLSLSGTPIRLSRIGGFVLIVAVWLSWAVLATVPFLDMADLPPVRAFFEAVSGLTTSGASVITNKEPLPTVLLLFRSQLEWMGGFLTICMVVLILAPAGAGGLPERPLVIYQRGNEGAVRQVWHIIRQIGLIYVSTTLLCSIGLMLTGTSPASAANLAMMAVATGGFTIFNGSLDSQVSASGLVVMTIFLFVGASNVFWLSAIRNGRWSQVVKFREPFILTGIALALAIIIGAELRIVGSSVPIGDLIAESLFNAISLISTSGVESRPGVFALLSVPALLFVILFGGSSFSTAGGIKLYRLGAMAAQSLRELNRLVYPSIVQNRQFGRAKLEMSVVNAVWSYFAVATTTVFVGIFALAASGLRFSEAVTASVAFFANAGPFYQAAAFQSSQALVAFADFSDAALLVGAIIMLFGRLEVIVLLGAITYLISLRR